MYKTIKNEEVNLDDWNLLSNSSNYTSWFQTSACYSFYKELSFLTPFVYAVELEGKLQALVCGYLVFEKGLIKSYFSRRAIIPGGVLVAKDADINAIEILLEELKYDLNKKAIYIEFRNFHDYSSCKNVFIKVGFNYHEHLNFQIELPSKEIVLSNLGENRKRQIKQSQNSGVYYIETSDKKDIIAYYKILSDTYSKKLKLPLFPLEFFITLIRESYGHLLVVKDNDENVLGGIVCVGDGNTLYEWFVCGLDGAYEKTHPSVMATWAGIEYALDNSFKTFDFMGAGKPDEKYGVREFKARFGGQLVEYGRFIYICNSILYKIGKFAIEFKQSMLS